MVDPFRIGSPIFNREDLQLLAHSFMSLWIIGIT
jgi:hypothetical protein